MTELEATVGDDVVSFMEAEEKIEDLQAWEEEGEREGLTRSAKRITGLEWSKLAFSPVSFGISNSRGGDTGGKV